MTDKYIVTEDDLDNDSIYTYEDSLEDAQETAQRVKDRYPRKLYRIWKEIEFG